jgi:hypothetical protein
MQEVAYYIFKQIIKYTVIATVVVYGIIYLLYKLF